MKYGERAIKEGELQTWENPSPDRPYTVDISFPEFTCLCPHSGYPDFAVIRISYCPAERIVELRSLKHYLNAFRNRYMNHEEATNRIYGDLYALLSPRRLSVTGEFNVRGGLKTVVRVSSDDSNAEQEPSRPEVNL
jgi:7-cyano-7-deazaguanine reductase